MIEGRQNGKHFNQSIREQLEALEAQDAEEEAKRQNDARSFIWPEKFTPEQRVAIGLGIKEARNKEGLTQGSLEKLCKLNVGFVSVIESGRSAAIDKVMIKKIGVILHDDFNVMVRDACAPKLSFVPGAQLVTDEEKTYKITGDTFAWRCRADSDTFQVTFINKDGEETSINSGKRDKNNLFVQSLKKIISIIEKGL